MSDITLSVGLKPSKSEQVIDDLYKNLQKVEKEQEKILQLQKQYEESIEKMRTSMQTKKDFGGNVSVGDTRAFDELIQKSADLTDRYEELGARASKFKCGKF